MGTLIFILGVLLVKFICVDALLASIFIFLGNAGAIFNCVGAFFVTLIVFIGTFLIITGGALVILSLLVELLIISFMYWFKKSITYTDVLVTF